MQVQTEEGEDFKMSRRLCVMCDLAGTVNIMPVGKSLNKFGLLSKEIYHDLHKTNVNEGIKWRGLLHSINFQENKLARLALIELVRIENHKIADELEKPEYRRQIGCVCGQSVHAPHLKRSNSLSHIMESSSHHESESFSFGRSRFDFSAFNGNFPDAGEPRDDKWKYMSLQPMKSPVPPSNKSRRRSRSLEILRPFTAVDRQIYIPKPPDSESSSEAGSINDEVSHILAEISSLNKDYEENQLEKNNNKHFKESIDSGIEDKSYVSRNRRLESEENFFSGFPSSSSVDSVVERVSFDDTYSAVFSESRQEHDQSIGSPDLESTRAEMDMTSDDDVTMMSSGLSNSGGLQRHGEILDLTDAVNMKKTSLSPHTHSSDPMSFTNNSSNERTRESDGVNTTEDVPDSQADDYNVLLVCVVGLFLLLAAALYFLPERFISSVVVLVFLQLYTERRKRRLAN